MWMVYEWSVREIAREQCIISLFAITSCRMSDNWQTIYYTRRIFVMKVCSNRLLMTFFVYNYVILEYGVFIFLDLKQIATVCSVFSNVMCGDDRYVDDVRILVAIELYLKSGLHS